MPIACCLVVVLLVLGIAWNCVISKFAWFQRNAEEASIQEVRQGVGMNYNNFSCRLIAPRLPAVAQAVETRKEEPKKDRKPAARRRLGTIAAAMVGVCSLALGASASASSLDVEQQGLQWVPATETVAFTGNLGRLTLDLPMPETVEERDLAAQLEAFSAQVNALTAKSFQSVRPAQAMQLSALTGVLLCAGLSVAIVRAGLLFRSDLTC